MAYDFPSSPSAGQEFTPAGGPTYVWESPRWKAKGITPGVLISDTPPASPVIGQMFWESDTGDLFVWYDDGNSQQWVQISGTSAAQVAEAPLDGNEYVRVNGVWRLSRQTYDLTGKTQQDAFAPSWGPTQLRIAIFLYANNVALSPSLQMSADGSTFVGTTGAYAYGGFYHATGSIGYANTPMQTAQYWPLSVASDNVDIPHTIDGIINLSRSVSGLIALRVRANSYHSNASYGWVDAFYQGYLQDGLTTGLYKGVRLNLNTGVMSGKMVVEWLP